MNLTGNLIFNTENHVNRWKTLILMRIIPIQHTDPCYSCYNDYVPHIGPATVHFIGYSQQTEQNVSRYSLQVSGNTERRFPRNMSFRLCRLQRDDAIPASMCCFIHLLPFRPYRHLTTAIRYLQPTEAKHYHMLMAFSMNGIHSRRRSL